MKIAYFTESLRPLVDGVSLTLGQLFDTLERRAIGFRVFSPFVPDHSVEWRDRVRRVPWLAFPLYRDYRVSIPGVRRLSRELDDFAPDLIHVASPTPMGVWAQHYAARRRLPVAATFHTNFVAYFRYYGLRRLERLGWAYLAWFYGRCVATYAPSRSMACTLEARGIPGVRTWSRGVDSARFSPRRRDGGLRSRLGVSVERPLLLMVSRLVKEKDLADLVAMHRILRARGLRYRLALVGDGPLRERLERELPNAHFAGHRTGRDLARWYASGDVFIFPSTTETFGNVVLEALASGLPAVVVDRGGPQDVIEPGRSGLVARANDPDDLADTVEPLLQDPVRRRRMGRAARQRAAARDWDVVNGRLLDSYRELTAQDGAPIAVRRSA